VSVFHARFKTESKAWGTRRERRNRGYLRRFRNQDKGAGISRLLGTDSRFAGKGWVDPPATLPIWRFEGRVVKSLLRFWWN